MLAWIEWGIEVGYSSVEDGDALSLSTVDEPNLQCKASSVGDGWDAGTRDAVGGWDRCGVSTEDFDGATIDLSLMHSSEAE